jgi:hypothetical protein
MAPIPRYDETVGDPLRAGDDIVARVRTLVCPARRAQTWFLFLDADDVQLPVLIPVDDVPADDAVGAARELLRALRTATDAAALVAVLERPAGPVIGDLDQRWARALRRAAAAEHIDLRALLLCHGDDVRALDPEELPRPAERRARLPGQPSATTRR